MIRTAITALLVLAALVMLLGLANEPDDNVQQAEFYCYMVHLHDDNPEQGWPDFKGVYRDQCTPGGQLVLTWGR
jgi:hypothetical protein